MNHSARHTSRFRRSFASIGLVAVLAISSLALTQCRAVQDSVTGLDLRTAEPVHGRSDCVKRCRATLQVDRKKEQSRYQEALKVCDRDRKCRRAEKDLHQQILKELNQQLLKCKRGCYNEGSGGAGR